MLWAVGLSGDWPILLATIDSAEGLPTLRQLLSAHQYWRRRGMMVDLVILNTRASSYLEALGDQVTATVLSSSEAGMLDRPGGRLRPPPRSPRPGGARACSAPPRGSIFPAMAGASGPSSDR